MQLAIYAVQIIMVARWIAILALPSVFCVLGGSSRGGWAHALLPSGNGQANCAGRWRRATTGRRILESCGPIVTTIRGRRSSNVVASSTSSSASSAATTSSSSSSSSSELGSAAESNEATKTAAHIELYSVDVRYNLRSQLTYEASTGRYLDIADAESMSSSGVLAAGGTTNNNGRNWGQFLHSAFVPEGVSPSYYGYVRWRLLQRFVNANVHVIGTQSLLMGLRGMQQGGRIAVETATTGGTTATLGAAAATNWVLKDTLGKVVRMAWASRMGRKFDPDAKRWRFRASLIYALGNGLEVCTYLHPRYFLALAMLANSCKQMSMLTSSATRNAIYNSFRRIDNESSMSSMSSMSSSSSSSSGGINVAPAAVDNGLNGTVAAIGSGNGRRGSGGVENIGDITAKGEAQIAVVDLLGIVSGICLSSE